MIRQAGLKGIAVFRERRREDVTVENTE